MYEPWHVFALLASAKVRVTYVHEKTLMSISDLCNSRARASNSGAKALRGPWERSQVTCEYS